MTRKKAIISGCIAVAVVVIALICYALADSGIQKWICSQGIKTLQEKLGTRVAVKNIDLELFNGRISMYGFELDDKKKVRMLKVDTLCVSADVWALLHKDIILHEVSMRGATAVLYKDSKNSPANYQFVIDAFKSKKKNKKSKNTDIQMHLEDAEFARLNVTWDVKSERMKGGDTLDVNHLRLHDMQINMKGQLRDKKTADARIWDIAIQEAKSGLRLTLDDGEYRTIGGRSVSMVVSGFEAYYQRKHVYFKDINVWQNHGTLQVKEPFSVKVNGLHYQCNNGKPRKNYNKPNRGYFDAGHLDAIINADIEMHYVGKDSITGTLRHLDANDKGSGLIIKDLSLFFNVHHKVADLTMVKILLPKSVININKSTLAFTQKKNVIVEPTHVTATMILTDIAKPFAPKLSNFTTPLCLSVDTWGDMECLNLHNIYVYTKDSRLRVTAEGNIVNILKKHQLTLHFFDIHMSARSGIKEQLVDHFKKKVNLKMERQMKAVGDVEFSGKMTIPYKHVAIGGLLITKFGDVDFDFDISNITHFLTGTMRTTNLELGKLMNVTGMGAISAHADYSFNVWSKRKLKEAGRYRGKLPIGWMKATVNEVTFKGIRFYDIQSEIKSDGAIAEGEIFTSFKAFNLDALFQYKQTEKEQWWKVKPRISKSAKSLAEQKAKDRAKAKKKADKAARKAQRQQLKESTKALFSKIKEQISSIKNSKKGNTSEEKE